MKLTTSRHRSTVLVSIIVLSAVVGCGSTKDTAVTSGEVSTTQTDTSPVAPSDGADDGQETLTPTGGTTSTNSDAGVEPAFGLQESTSPGFPDNVTDVQLVLTEVRTGSGNGYDRAVFEFSGEGTPGYLVRYIDGPVRDISGEEPPLQGKAFLEVIIGNTPYELDLPTPGPTKPQEPIVNKTFSGVGDIASVWVGGPFEGQTNAAVGVTHGREPFRVFTLTSPSRLVIDVKNG